jgi:hypothetical protein
MSNTTCKMCWHVFRIGLNSTRRTPRDIPLHPFKGGIGSVTVARHTPLTTRHCLHTTCLTWIQSLNKLCP